MAYKTHSTVLPLISVFVVLLALAGEVNAGRNVPTNPSGKDDKKQPQWLIGNDRSFLIPGLGRVMIPPIHTVSPHTPFPSTPSTGSGSGRRYVPGGDDTFVPNPGYEVPIPGSVPANLNP